MEMTIAQQIGLSLISGVIGAVAGGFISYKGAMDAAKKTIEHLYEQDEKKRKQNNKDQILMMCKFLLAESQENLRLCKNWKVNHSKVLLSSEAWAVYKGMIISLPDALQERLLITYSSIKRYNSLVEYERLKIDYGHGSMDGVIQQEVTGVSQTLEPMVDELKKYIGSI